MTYDEAIAWCAGNGAHIMCVQAHYSIPAHVYVEAWGHRAIQRPTFLEAVAAFAEWHRAWIHSGTMGARAV